MRPLALLLMLLWPAMLVQAQHHRSDALDDVAQHVPMATVVVLHACGVDGRSAGWGRLALSAGAAYVLSAATTYSLKHLVDERRPDHSDRRAFPSGHATMAFAGATAMRHEYGHLSPWVTVGGYTLAALTAADRVRLDRHYVHDVLAGAAIGAGMTELVYYINKRYGRARENALTVVPTPDGLALALTF